MSGSNRRDRGAVLALGLILLAVVLVAAISVAGQPVHQAVATAGDSQPAQDGHNNSPPGVASPDDFNPWQDKYDQWAIAAVSIVAAGVSVWALRFVKKTWEETERTAAEAVRANQIAQRSAIQQLRAYLSSPEITSEDVVVGKTPTIRIRIKNTGQTPAYLIRARAYVRTCTTDPETLKLSAAGSPQATTDSTGIVGAGLFLSHDIMVGAPLSEPGLTALYLNYPRVVVAGFVIYKDIFGRTRRMTYRATMNMPSRKDGKVLFVSARRNNKSN